MASSTKTSTLLLASLLCLVILSEVEVLMADQVVSATATGAGTWNECPKKCKKRCSNSYVEKCTRACMSCCHRCPDHCVPDGPTASRDSCHCYSQVRTHNKYKCP